LNSSPTRVLVPFVNDTARLSPPERFNSLIEGLFSDVATRAANPWFSLALVELVLIKLIWRRLRRMSRRFAAIMVRFRAGTLPQAGTLPEAGSAPRNPAAAPTAGSPRPHEPWRPLGWVIHAVSWFVWVRHYELEEMLEDPETAAQVAGAPQLGRVLRPLCRMLAVKPPAWLRLPRRARRGVVEHPPAPDWLVNEPGAELRADGSVWMRVGASTLWKPGCGQTLEEAQKFDKPVRIWPRED
jgi:hypothetical protein